MGLNSIYFLALTITTNLLQVSPQYDPFPFFNIFAYDAPTLTDIGNMSDCHWRCPRIYIPICADDNVTYINECRMQCINQVRAFNNEEVATFVRTGPCKILPVEESYY